MKIRTMIVTAALALIAIAAVSCAKSAPAVLSEKDAMETFNRWVRKYAPNADSVGNGVFVEFFSRSNDWQSSAAPIMDTSWMLLNLTGYDMEGSIFGTRDSSKAQLLGTWAYTTHFVPQLLAYSKYNTALCPGLLFGLKYFRKGDIGRVYVATKLAYSSSTFMTGYKTSVSYDGYPIYYDVELVDMTSEPKKWEEAKVNEYVAKNWGYTIEDTVSLGLYKRTVVPKPDGYPITTDSTVYLRKVVRFLDGQLLSTNIDSVARAAHYYGLTQTEADYNVLVITPMMFSNDYTMSNQVYKKILPLMRVGEQVEVVGTSRWGIGFAGKVGNVPQISSYEPMRYYLHTTPYKK